MALHADTRELDPATRQRASDALGGFGGGAGGLKPEHEAPSGNEPLCDACKRCDTTDTNAELGWDAIRDIRHRTSNRCPGGTRYGYRDKRNQR